MALHNVSPVREQLRDEMLAALERGPLTTSDLYNLCPSADDPAEVARLAYELKKKGLVADGGKVLHALGMKVNSYVLASPTDPRIEAAKPLVVERKIPKTVKGTKPATGHPFQAPISPRAPQERREWVTRDLPQHLQSVAHQMAAESFRSHIEEQIMSEEPIPYVTEPDTFSQEPLEPEAQEPLDSDLVDALLAHLEPEAMASHDVGEIAAAMGKRHEGKITDGSNLKTVFGPEIFLPNEEPKKICQCLRINSLPRLPNGYIYGGIKVWIESEHDVGRLTIATHDEGGGAFVSLQAKGHLSFDTGDLVTIGQMADDLIALHESMDKQNND